MWEKAINEEFVERCKNLKRLETFSTQYFT